MDNRDYSDLDGSFIFDGVDNKKPNKDGNSQGPQYDPYRTKDGRKPRKSKRKKPKNGTNKLGRRRWDDGTW